MHSVSLRPHLHKFAGQAPVHQINSHTVVSDNKFNDFIATNLKMEPSNDINLSAASKSENNIAKKMTLPNVPQNRPIFPSIKKTIDSHAQYELRQPNERQESQENAQQPFLASTSSLNRDREAITLRGNLEILENVLIDVVSELKYHRQQVAIISAEKDTSGAVIQMGIAQAKNSVLSDELKTQQEMKRAERAQTREFERLKRQIDVLQGDTDTAETRLLQMQRRIMQLESQIGLPSSKFVSK